MGLAQWEHAAEAMPSWQTPLARVVAMCWAPPFGAHAYAYSTLKPGDLAASATPAVVFIYDADG